MKYPEFAPAGTRRPAARTVLEIGFLLGLVLTIVLTAALWQYRAVCDRVCQDTLRLHILANSDTLEDQLLKLRVRDAVLEQVAALTENAQDKQQAVQAVRAALPTLRATAEQTVRAAHSSQSVQCSLEQAEFAPRDYGTFSLPGGSYLALRIELGEAAGHNWFCVLYPALCVGSSDAEYAQADENALVFGEYRVRSALLDTARAAWKALRQTS